LGGGCLTGGGGGADLAAHVPEVLEDAADERVAELELNVGVESVGRSIARTELSPPEFYPSPLHTHPESYPSPLHTHPESYPSPLHTHPESYPSPLHTP